MMHGTMSLKKNDYKVIVKKLGVGMLSGAFAKLRKATVSFVMSVCPSASYNSAPTLRILIKFDILFFLFFHWRFSPLWALACRTMSVHFSLSVTNSLHLLTPSTWRFLSTSSLHPFLGLPLRFVPSSLIVDYFSKICRERVQVSLKSDKNNRYFTWRAVCAFWSYRAHLFLEWEIVQINVVEKIKTHILC